MDDASSENLERLADLAGKLIESKRDHLEKLAEKLV